MVKVVTNDDSAFMPIGEVTPATIVEIIQDDGPNGVFIVVKGEPIPSSLPYVRDVIRQNKVAAVRLTDGTIYHLERDTRVFTFPQACVSLVNSAK